MAVRRSSAVLICALVLVSCRGGDLPEVVTETVTSGAVAQTVAAPARIDAAARSDLLAGVAGRIATLEVDDGDAVSAGQVIARLDSEAVEEARRAAGQAAESGGAPPADIDGGGAATRRTVRQAVAELDAAVVPQLTAGFEAVAQIDDPEQRAAADRAILAVEAAYRASRAGLTGTGEAVAAQQDAAAAAISQAFDTALGQLAAPQQAQVAAAVQAAEAQADALVLTAPIDGVVQLGSAAGSEPRPDLGGLGGFGGLGELGGLGDLGGLVGGAGSGGEGGPLRVGSPVAPGQVVATVFDLSERFAVVDIDEIDAPAVSVGQEVEVIVDALPQATFAGTVTNVRLEAVGTGTGGASYPARVRLEQATPSPSETRDPSELVDALRIGMTGGADIVTAVVDGDLVVSSRALLRGEEGNVVLVVRDDRVERIAVAVLALGEETAAVEVREGSLEVGDDVVVAGGELLSDGDEVERVR